MWPSGFAFPRRTGGGLLARGSGRSPPEVELEVELELEAAPGPSIAR